MGKNGKKLQIRNLFSIFKINCPSTLNSIFNYYEFIVIFKIFIISGHPTGSSHIGFSIREFETTVEDNLADMCTGEVRKEIMGKKSELIGKDTNLTTA